MFSFALQAQIELSEDWSFKPDKGKHMVGGSVVSAATFSIVYHKTKDTNLAFRAGWMSSAFAAIGKEGFDFMEGKEVSLADMGYTIIGGVFSSSVMYFITKGIEKRKQNKKIRNIENITWSLENEIFIK